MNRFVIVVITILFLILSILLPILLFEDFTYEANDNGRTGNVIICCAIFNEICSIGMIIFLVGYIFKWESAFDLAEYLDKSKTLLLWTFCIGEINMILNIVVLFGVCERDKPCNKMSAIGVLSFLPCYTLAVAIICWLIRCIYICCYNICNNTTSQEKIKINASPASSV